MSGIFLSAADVTDLDDIDLAKLGQCGDVLTHASADL